MLLEKLSQHLWARKNAVRTSLLATALIAVGIPYASHAAQIRVTQMDFFPPGSASPAHVNATVAGSINLDTGTGSFNSGITDFFGFPWTATVVAYWATPGPNSFTGTVPAGNISPPAGTPYSYSFVLGPNQYAVGLFFNWGANTNIPVLAVFDCSAGTSCVAVDTDADGSPGTRMATVPFLNQTPAFSGFIPVQANNVSGINTTPTTAVTWSPSIVLDPSVTTYSCTVTQPPVGQGTATIASNCSSGTYDPQGYAGSTTFTYRIDSGTFNDTATATATTSLSPAPTAVNDIASTNVGASIAIDILANDLDQDGTIDPATVNIVTGPSSGNASVDLVTGVITYTPNIGFCGTDFIAYTVDDNDSQTSNTATVTITTLASEVCSSDSVTITGGSVDTDGDGMVTLSQILSAGIPADANATQQCVGGCFDFVVSGVNNSVTVYLPLSEPIPAAAQYRIWNGNAWVEFDTTDPNDQISSALSNGICSPTDAFSSGLTRGNNCLKLTIVDNGPNDLDPATGVVADTSGVVENIIPTASTSLKSGCTLSARPAPTAVAIEWLIVGTALVGLGLLRRRVS